METGLAKLRALDVIGLSAEDMADIRWRNAARLFGAGAFPRCTVQALAGDATGALASVT
jgi:hypothetical protein